MLSMDSSFSTSTFDVSHIDTSGLRIQILAYDSYRCLPSSLDKRQFSVNGTTYQKDSEEFSYVPVIRIFGRLQTGHTCLLHIHNVFPYIYIPFQGRQEGELITQLVKLRDEIELRIEKSYKRKKQDPDVSLPDESDTETGDASRQYIADISVVRGVPFYNYHYGFAPFVKISLLSSRYAVRLTKLLSDGVIFARKIQPFESHIPHTFQFLMDYNCYSCNWITLSKFFWRSPLVQLEQKDQPYFATSFGDFNRVKMSSDLKKFVGAYTVDDGTHYNVLDPEQFPRMSRTLLELDTASCWISNRLELKERNIHADLIDGPPDESVKYIDSTKALLADVKFQRQQRGLPVSDPKLKLFDDLDRDFSGEKWVEIDELKSLFDYCVSMSDNAYYQSGGTAPWVPPQKKWLDVFPTSFESVGKLQYEPDMSTVGLVSSQGSSDTLLNASKVKPHIFESVDLEDEGEEEAEEEGEEEEKEEEEEEDIENDAENVMAPHSEDPIETSTDDTCKADNTDLAIFEATQKARQTTSFSQLSPLRSQQRTHTESKFTHLFSDRIDNETVYQSALVPPKCSSFAEFMDTFEKDYGQLKIRYPDPFFSNRKNYDDRAFYFAGKKFRLKCLDHKGLEQYEGVGALSSEYAQLDDSGQTTDVWCYTREPPRAQDVEAWAGIHHDSLSSPSKRKARLLGSEIEPITQRLAPHKRSSATAPVERKRTNYTKLILLAVEIHVNTRGDLQPDPEKDAVKAIFWHFDKDHNPYPLNIPATGAFVVSGKGVPVPYVGSLSVRFFDDEKGMIAALVGLVELIDPDILGGYELHGLSWGYIIERWRAVYDVDLPVRFSRVVTNQNNKVGDRYGYTHASGIKITGRHMLNIWRRLRSEVRLGNYSLQNAVFNTLHVRIPHYSWKTLTRWFDDKTGGLFLCLVKYYLQQVELECEVVDVLEVIEKVTEESRLLGIDFYSVIYRGSQFKVESLLVRLAKAEDYILVSPSKKQVFNQDALECIPLVLEPESALYKSPLVVLDFQSLYPSIVIAYNYCFSTLVGRLRGFDPAKSQKLGVVSRRLPNGILGALKDDITLSANGLMFTKPHVRKSLIAKMLTEILDARIFVKGTMGKLHNDHELAKMYHNRQLALKLIANVTYGYTSATFSGRMPHSAIADAIVSSGRETLLRAASEIESHSEWGAKVVYGDTDSLFVYLPGKTREDAFRIGRAMAARVTRINPAPVKLKFEKVYHPCVLVSKKRYIGWKYKYEDQRVPDFDAKGIETVRRDGIPAQQKIVEKCITLLFKTMDISQVKSYVLAQFTKIMRGHVNLRDFLFAKEVRVGTYKNEAYIPPGARVSMAKMEKDHRAEPQYRERVFYVVKKGQKNQKLRDRCVSPEDFLNDSAAELDSEYYITKVLVPPLERIFNLLGVDVKAWYDEMPKYISVGKAAGLKNLNARTRQCLGCGGVVGAGSTVRLCDDCLARKQESVLRVVSRVKTKEKHLRDLYTICDGCARRTTGCNSIKLRDSLACDSQDCPIYYDREKTVSDVEALRLDLQSLPEW